MNEPTPKSVEKAREIVAPTGVIECLVNFEHNPKAKQLHDAIAATLDQQNAEIERLKEFHDGVIANVQCGACAEGIFTGAVMSGRKHTCQISTLESELSSAKEQIDRYESNAKYATDLIATYTSERDAAREEIERLKEFYTELILGYEKQLGLKEGETIGAAITNIQSQLAKARELAPELEALLCDVAQLLDGWHSDGTCWTEWDESVRKRVSNYHKKTFLASEKEAR